MDRFDQISLLYDAQQLFLMEALDCESKAQDTKSEKYAALLRKRAKMWQEKAEQSGAWKNRLERQG